MIAATKDSCNSRTDREEDAMLSGSSANPRSVGYNAKPTGCSRPSIGPYLQLFEICRIRSGSPRRFRVHDARIQSLHKIKRPLHSLVEHAAHIFPDYPEREELDSAQEQN